MKQQSRGMVHFTVGASASEPTDHLNLVPDLRLVKAGLLYGDRVTLFSIKSFFVLGVMSFRDAKPKDKIRFIRQMLPMVDLDEVTRNSIDQYFAQYDSLKNIRHPTSKQIAAAKKTEQILVTQFASGLEPVMDNLLEEFGTHELLKARDSGLIEIHEFSTEFSLANMHKSRAGGPWLDRLVQEYFQLVSKSVIDGRTYPIFDDQTGELIRLAIKEGNVTVTEPHIAQARHSATAADFIERLPLFDCATIDEVLTIRRELDKYLVRFRQAIIGYSEKIKVAAWDEGFAADANRVFLQDVAPTVLELEEAVRSNSFVLNVLKHIDVKSSIGIPTAAGVLTTTLSHVDQLPQIAAHALAAGVGITAIPIANKLALAAADYNQKQREHQKNQFYFYYEAQRQFSKL